MLDALKIRLRTGQKALPVLTLERAARFVSTVPKQRGRFAFTLLERGARSAFTAPELRGRSRAFTLKQREPEAFTLLPELLGRSRAFTQKQRERCSFTLLELLVVIGIIALLMVLLAPAFTTLKSAGDVTNAAYTIKGVLDSARTYAKANNTYTWVGFFEEDVSTASKNPATAAVGRLVMSIVASSDGTVIYDPSSPAAISPTKLTQVGKLTKIENVHLWTHTDSPSDNGFTFDTRPNVPSTYCVGDTTPPVSLTSFQYPVGNPAPSAQYTFRKAVQFSPGGEGRIDNNSYSLQSAAEIGLKATHGAIVDTNGRNVVAIQFGGVGGGVRIYRR